MKIELNFKSKLTSFEINCYNKIMQYIFSHQEKILKLNIREFIDLMYSGVLTKREQNYCYLLPIYNNNTVYFYSTEFEEKLICKFIIN